MLSSYDTFFKCQIIELAELGKKYPFPIPACCPQCDGRIRKHGFATAYFFPYIEPLFIQRLRCRDCRMVFRFRPSGYLPRLSTPLLVMYRVLFPKKRPSNPAPVINASTKKSWLKKLKKQIKVVLGSHYKPGYELGFINLVKKGFSPVSSAFNSKIPVDFFKYTETSLYSR